MKIISEARGFTLVELMVAIAVLSIILTVAVPSITSMRDRNRVRAAAEAVYAHLQFARSESIKQDRNLTVRVATGTNWCLGISNSSGCDCQITNSCQFGPAGGLLERNLSGNDFSDITLTSNQSNISFDSRRGIDLNPGTITLTGGNLLAISVIHSSRGRIRLCSGNIGGYAACP